MVFVRSYDDGRSRHFDGVEKLCAYLDALPGDFYIHDGRRILKNFINLENDKQLWLCLRLPGGKGGFGSNLRAQGNRLSKRHRSGNYESCRDAETGMRLRDKEHVAVIKAQTERGGVLVHGDAVDMANRRRAYEERQAIKQQKQEHKITQQAITKTRQTSERAHKEAMRVESILQKSSCFLQKESLGDEKGKEPLEPAKRLNCAWDEDLDCF